MSAASSLPKSFSAEDQMANVENNWSVNAWLLKKCPHPLGHQLGRHRQISDCTLAWWQLVAGLLQAGSPWSWVGDMKLNLRHCLRSPDLGSHKETFTGPCLVWRSPDFETSCRKTAEKCISFEILHRRFGFLQPFYRPQMKFLFNGPLEGPAAPSETLVAWRQSKPPDISNRRINWSEKRAIKSDGSGSTRAWDLST